MSAWSSCQLPWFTPSTGCCHSVLWCRSLQELEPKALEIHDDSEGEESKFSVYIVSKAFEGMNTLKRHRTVYAILDKEMKVVHALSMVTKTPEEAGL